MTRRDCALLAGMFALWGCTGLVLRACGWEVPPSDFMFLFGAAAYAVHWLLMGFRVRWVGSRAANTGGDS